MRRGFAIGACALALSAAAVARAADPGALKQARTYFNVGARAYAAGQFLDAVKAFQQAYKLTPRTGLLFSIAQAYRKQYYVDKKPENLRAAIKYYHEYLDRVPKGGRRGDVADALTELEPLAEKLQAETAPAPPPAAKPATQIMISSPTPGVRLTLDGHAAGKLPFVSDVKPGQHHVALSAPGFKPYERDISVLEGGVVPLDVALEDKPATLRIRAPEGAHVSIDGREVGRAPVRPIQLAPGQHFVAVTGNGRRPFAQDLALERGRSVSLDAKLPHTTQRTVSWLLLGTGATAVVGGTLLGLAAYRKQSDAQDILDRRQTRNIQQSDRDAYAQLVLDRNRLRAASVVTAGAGVAIAATGLVLFIFDEPRVRPRSGPEPSPGGRPQHRAPSMEISAAPVLSPATAGAAVSGRF